MLTWRTAAGGSMLALGLLLLALGIDTAPLDMRPEFGFDGIQYLRLVDALRGGHAAAPEVPWAFRLLPAAIVAASGLEPTVGFFALDVASLLATGLLVVVLLRADVTPDGAVVTVLAWALLPFGLRYALHYPVLTDAPGTLLVVALLLAAARTRHVAFAALLAAAVLTRESLVICAPLLLLRVSDRGWRPIAGAAIAAVPAIVVLAAVHVWTPIAPAAAGDSTFEQVGSQAYVIATNTNGAAWRLLGSPLLALGAIGGLLLSRHALAAIRAEPGWSYLLVAGVVTAALGGGDHDRYLSAFAPLVLVSGVRAIPRPARTRTMVVVLALQIVAARVAVPLGSDLRTHLQFGVSFMPLDVLARWNAVIAACCAAVAVVSATAGRWARTR